MSMKKMLAVAAAAALVAAPAFAANPFSDVPMNHWAYDAVEELSAKGILEGYPNGTFKGNKAMTRYEIATMVARMMANGGASGADLEKLKALVVEFQPELEALGVKVDGFDSRIAKLEKGIGGLKIWGQMRFDYFAYDKPTERGGITDNGFQFNRARLFMQKDLGNGVTFDVRWHADAIDRYFVTARNFAGVKGLAVTLGQFAWDPEGDDGLYQSGHYYDDDALFFDGGVKGARLEYKVGGLSIDAIAGSNTGVYAANNGDDTYGARIKYDAGKFWVSANAFKFDKNNTAGKEDEKTKVVAPDDVGDSYNVYWFGAGLDLIKGVSLKGAYYMEDIDALAKEVAPEDDDPKAYRIVLELGKELLKFTTLRAEYLSFDKGFITANTPYTFHSGVKINDADAKFAEDTDVVFVKAVQSWTKKLTTFERWGQYDMDGADYGKAKEWGVGVAYKYTPAIEFILDYTDFDGQLKGGKVDPDYDNNVVRFRTVVNF